MRALLSIGIAAAVTVTHLAPSLSVAAPSSRYAVSGVTITDLGTLGGTSSTANDINNDGFIVGWAMTAAGEQHAFYLRPTTGSLYDIADRSGLGTSEAHGINNDNYVVGSASFDDDWERAFRWYAGSAVILTGPLSPSADRATSVAYAISDRQHVVGQRSPAIPLFEATLWPTEQTHDLLPGPNPQPRLNTFANDVNASGQVVGRESVSNMVVRWQWTPTGITQDVLPGLFGLFNIGDARGINRWGTVVGFDRVCCDASGRHFVQRASLWDGVSPQEINLGVLLYGTFSVAEDINDESFVVGFGDRNIWIGGGTQFRLIAFDSAFIYHSDFGLVELRKLPGAPLGDCHAHALNERQTANGLVQVVGFCRAVSGDLRAVRWDVTVTTARILPPPF